MRLNQQFERETDPHQRLRPAQPGVGFFMERPRNMAMEEWIPIRLDLAQDPDVIRMANRMKPAVRPEVIVGYLCSVWSWASKASEDGTVSGLTLDQIESTLHLPTFLHLMQEVGWVSEVVATNGAVVTFENWEVWNSESRKKRLKSAKGKKIKRADKCPKKRGQMSKKTRTPCSCSCSSLTSSKKKKRNTPFTPPTVDEVRTYCQERGNSIDPEAFVAYYTSNGWKVGRNPMKDWKAAVRSWERKQSQGQTADQKATAEYRRRLAGEESRRQAQEERERRGRSGSRRSDAEEAQTLNAAINTILQEDVA